MVLNRKILPRSLVSMPSKVTHDSHCQIYFYFNSETASIIYSFAKGEKQALFIFLWVYIIYNKMGIYKLYSMTGFDIRIYLKSSLNLDSKHIHNPKRLLMPLQNLSPTPSQFLSPKSHFCLQATADLLLSI